MMYAAGETELVLQIAPDRQAERLKLAGQVLDDGMPVEGAAINLLGPSHTAGQETDEEGEFLIGALPAGTYCLEIDTPGRSMSVTPLDME
jgi:hypothetical protein